MILGQNSFSQNQYGWERILNSIYGINGFYVTPSNSNSNKVWLVRTIGDLYGTGNYDFIKYNEISNSWYPSSHLMLRANWYSYSQGPFNYSGWLFPSAFSISPLDSNFIIANIYDQPPASSPPQNIKFYYSFNNGSTKTEIPVFYGSRFNGLSINPVNDSVCYAAKADTIYKSSNRSFSWTAVSSIPYFNGSLIINSIDTSFLYAMDDSLFISSDGGSSFAFVVNLKFKQLIYRLSDSLVFGISKNKLYVSSDFGYNWSKRDSLPDSINVIDSDPDNENILYAGTDRGLYKSTDEGSNFFLFNNSFSPSRKVLALCKQANRNFVYAVTEEAVYKCWDNYVIGINQLSENTPGSYRLYQNFPNPFNPTTKIKYDLELTAHVVLKAYDVLGNEVSTLVSQQQNPGNYIVNFDGAKFSNGIYFYSLFIDGKKAGTKKMILIK